MPFKDPQRRREWERAYRPAYRRRKREEEARRRAEEEARKLKEAELRARSLVPMRLRYPLEFADHSHRAGEVVWVLPGTAHLLERAHLADYYPTGEWVSYGVRVLVPTGR